MRHVGKGERDRLPVLWGPVEGCQFRKKGRKYGLRIWVVVS